jgi:hypothetical protein
MARPTMGHVLAWIYGIGAFVSFVDVLLLGWKGPQISYYFCLPMRHGNAAMGASGD